MGRKPKDHGREHQLLREQRNMLGRRGGVAPAQALL